MTVGRFLNGFRGSLFRICMQFVVSGFVVSCPSQAGYWLQYQCASSVKIKTVEIGNNSLTDANDPNIRNYIGITVYNPVSAITTKFTTYGLANIKEGPEERSLLSAALAAQASQMDVTVYIAGNSASECSPTVGTNKDWVQHWSGLVITAN
jgi:hypothetical protein